ncbi:hypothetical protein AK812_SmicGene41187 [Symbiodinium microadriaticum]|uniref:Uncharacterized protein n=1 Tax=Symbiodinium microadriaticum TaxID=2951 RepID=A0A1Q9C6R0_SYMMI|nr:hypothetical protein AK812_SmicGene41187 [Symbiodinium microadriaticum]
MTASIASSAVHGFRLRVLKQYSSKCAAFLRDSRWVKRALGLGIVRSASDWPGDVDVLAEDQAALSELGLWR